MIKVTTRWILQEACKEAARWKGREYTFWIEVTSENQAAWKAKLLQAEKRWIERKGSFTLFLRLKMLNGVFFISFFFPTFIIIKQSGKNASSKSIYKDSTRNACNTRRFKKILLRKVLWSHRIRVLPKVRDSRSVNSFLYSDWMAIEKQIKPNGNCDFPTYRG